MNDELATAAHPACSRPHADVEVLCVTKAAGTLWLLQSQSLHTFVVVKGASVLTLNGLAVLVTVGAAVLVARHEGLLPTGEVTA